MLKRAKSIFFILCLTGLMFQYVNCAEDIEGGFFNESSLEGFDCGSNCGGQNSEYLQLGYTAGEIQVLEGTTSSVISGYCHNGGYDQLEVLVVFPNGAQSTNSVLCEDNRFHTTINYPLQSPFSAIAGQNVIRLQLSAILNGERLTNQDGAIIQIPIRLVTQQELALTTGSAGIF